MVKTTYFTGMAFDKISAIDNANSQADNYISQANGKRKEISRNLITFSNHGSFYSVTLSLIYEVLN